MPRYFARCLRGLEAFVLEELRKIPDVSVSNEAIRTLFFTYEEPPTPLLELRSLDDLFLHVGEIKDLDHTRASLTRIPQCLFNISFDFPEIKAQLQQVRDIPSKPSFSITVGLQGKKNFSRFELTEAVLPFFKQKIPASFLPNEPGNKGADIDVRLIFEGDKVQIGVRLPLQPLHRRFYKQHNVPGSTKPPLAYMMAAMADINSSHIVLDPCCGVGTLLIEAVLGFEPKRCLGFDKEEDRIQMAKQNAQLAQVEIELEQGDALKLNLEDSSIDRIICNPPWGRQVESVVELEDFYHDFLGNCERVLKSGGLVVMLSNQERVITRFAEKELGLRLQKQVPLSLFGSLVHLFILGKS